MENPHRLSLWVTAVLASVLLLVALLIGRVIGPDTPIGENKNDAAPQAQQKVEG